MTKSENTASIPMLKVYSEQFNSGGAGLVAGRKGRLFMEICKPGKVTRKQLAHDFDIRPGTVSSIVLQLIEQGLVSEGRPSAPYQKGRPEILLHPVTSGMAVMVFHVVSQSIHLTLVDFGGNQICSAQKEVRAEQVSNEILQHLLVNMVQEVRAQAPDNTRILGISFSLPGIVNEVDLVWVFATSRWPQIRNMDLSSIAASLDLDVILNKNLNCELRARIARRAEPSSSSILIIHWGHGIGVSFSLNGSILVSGNGGFGEIGHSYVHGQKEAQCRCGMKNCLETQAALWALLPGLRKIYSDVPTDEWSFESFLKERGDFDLAILDNAVHHMAVAMRNITLVLSPDKIVINGPFVQHREIFERLYGEYKQLLPAGSHVFTHRDVEVAVGRTGAEDEIIGAAYPLFENALKTMCT